MKLPLSVTNGVPSGFIRRAISPWQPASAAIISTMSRVAFQPNWTTSTGSGNVPSVCDQLALVGNHDHALRRRRDDLLAQQRAAAALDQAQLVVDLVGAVDGQVEIRLVVERRQRDAEALGLRRVASEVGTQTTFRPSSTRSASSSTNCSAVEPVPSRAASRPRRIQSPFPPPAA